MATAKKTAAKADTKPKAPKAAPAAAPTASPPADPPAAQPAPSTASPAAETTQQPDATSVEPTAKGRKWTAHEIVDGVAQPVGEVVQSVHRLERAQSLIELSKGTGMTGELVAEGIQSFKDTDGRTMNVVVSGGALYKQEV